MDSCSDHIWWGACGTLLGLPRFRDSVARTSILPLYKLVAHPKPVGGQAQIPIAQGMVWL